MIAKNIDQITEEDLQALVDNSVVERKTLEYKQALPGNSDKEKKEFLADVSSFANASGGDLIYGIVEDKKTGTPKSLDGLSAADIDGEILRLEGMIRTGIEPRIPSVRTQPVALKNSRVALVIRVPKSWISPHRVTFGGHNEFYSRSSNGKYPLDVGELRVAFNLSETATERIRNFRLDRISKIFAGETPIPFYNNPKIVLHLIPMIAFTPAQIYDLSAITSNPTRMPLIHSTGWDWKYNLDGFLTYSSDRYGVSRSYTQLFRNGIIEAVEASLLRPRVERPTIPSVIFEEKLISALTDYLSILKILNVEPPAFVFLTLLGVKGFSMGINPERYIVDEIHTIDRDILQLPEVIVESYDVKAEDILKPCFDSIWNACGFKGSFNYNEKEEWAPR